MRISFLISLILPVIAAHSQKVIDVGKNDVPVSQALFYSVGGQPVSIAKYVRVVDGSPYFSDAWLIGRVINDKDARFDSVLLRLDLVENALHFMDTAGQELVATSPIKSILLLDPSHVKEYRFVNSLFLPAAATKDAAWYQLLDSGRAFLLKRYEKTILESKPYGSATVEQRIVTTIHYFVVVNSDFIPLKKFKDLPGLLKDKENELEIYIDHKNLTGRSEADYIALVTYYNSLASK